jgi:hypothetical protein
MVGRGVGICGSVHEQDGHGYPRSGMHGADRIRLKVRRRAGWSRPPAPAAGNWRTARPPPTSNTTTATASTGRDSGIFIHSRVTRLTFQLERVSGDPEKVALHASRGDTPHAMSATPRSDRRPIRVEPSHVAPAARIEQVKLTVDGLTGHDPRERDRPAKLDDRSRRRLDEGRANSPARIGEGEATAAFQVRRLENRHVNERRFNLLDIGDRGDGNGKRIAVPWRAIALHLGMKHRGTGFSRRDRP